MIHVYIWFRLLCISSYILVLSMVCTSILCEVYCSFVGYFVSTTICYEKRKKRDNGLFCRFIIFLCASKKILNELISKLI